MTSPDAPSIEMPTFSPEQLTALIDYMEAAGKGRAGTQGADFSEADYLAGCMATLFALGRQDKIPAGWIFEMFAGNSPLGVPTLDQQVYLVVDRKVRGSGTVTVYRDRVEATEHADHLNEREDFRAFLLQEPIRHVLRPDVAAALQAADEAEEVNA